MTAKRNVNSWNSLAATQDDFQFLNILIDCVQLSFETDDAFDLRCDRRNLPVEKLNSSRDRSCPPQRSGSLESYCHNHGNRHPFIKMPLPILGAYIFSFLDHCPSLVIVDRAQLTTRLCP